MSKNQRPQTTEKPKARDYLKQQKAKEPNDRSFGDNYYGNDTQGNKNTGGIKSEAQKLKKQTKPISNMKQQSKGMQKQKQDSPIKKQVQSRQQSNSRLLRSDTMLDLNNLVAQVVIQQNTGQLCTCNKAITIDYLNFQFNHLANLIVEKQSKSTEISNPEYEKVKNQLRESLRKNALLEKEKNKNKTQYQALLSQFKESESRRIKAQSKNEPLYLELKENEDKLKVIQQNCNELKRKNEELLRVFNQHQIQPKTKEQHPQEKSSESIKFYSALAIENNLSSFIKEAIYKSTKKNLSRAKLIYQKDDFNTNMLNYLDRPPFPVVFLLSTKKNNIFGIFGEGMETYRTNLLKEKKQFDKPFTVFLFNATNRTIIPRDERSKVACGLSFFENYLRFGNNQLTLKNGALTQMKFQGSSIFGQKYFNIPKRQMLTGEESDLIDIKQIEIFELFLSDI